MIVTIVFSLLPLNADTQALRFPAFSEGVIQSLCVFALTFFVGHVMSKYVSRFNNITQTNGNVTRLTATAAASLAKPEAYAMVRYTNSIMHIYYYLMSGPLDESRWTALKAQGLLSEPEVALLQKQGSPGVVLYRWACQIIIKYAQSPNASTAMELAMESCVGGARGLSAKQVAYTLVQVPYIYYSAVTILVNLFVFELTLDGFGNHWLNMVNRSCANFDAAPLGITTGHTL